MRAIIYWDDRAHFQYEAGEFHGGIDARELSKVIGNCMAQGYHVPYKRTNSQTFEGMYRKLGIVAMTPEGDPLPIPLAFAEFTGAIVPVEANRRPPEVRRIFDASFAGEVDKARGHDPMHLSSLRSVLSEQSVNPAAGNQQFPLHMRFAESYDDLVAGNYSTAPLAPTCLLDSLPVRVLISAAGGAGKSSALCAVATAALDRGLLPYYVSASTKRIGGERLPREYSLAEFLDKLSVAGSVGDFFACLASGKPTILLIDGLNEVYREASEQVLRWLCEEVTRWSNLSVIVADRLTPQRPLAGFRRATVEPLARDDVSTALGRALPEQEAVVNLLRIPFFLDLQIRARGQAYRGRAGMIERYLRERANLTDPGDWSKLTQCAFDSYRQFKWVQIL